MRHKSLTATIILLAVGIAFSVWGDPTSLSISNASVTVTSSSSTTLNFPISRSGDTSYDAFVQYQTQNGTAIAGTDYSPAMGSIVIPAGTTSATIPVTVAGSTSNPPDKTFQMFLLGGGGAARTFTPSFATQQTFFTENDAASVTVDDVNGDGKPDLIVANFDSNTVSVLLNSTAPGATTPGFATQQTFATGTEPISVTVADVNGDGMPDLIVANEGDNTVSVLLNTTAPGATTPSFATQQTFATGNEPNSVTVADVNGDGKPDLIVANAGNNTVSVLLNTTTPGAATPSFATKQTFATGNEPISVTVADVNGDGKPDLIVANYSDGTVSVLLNTTAPGATTPSFATKQTFATGSGPRSVTVGDVNGDGKPDLIVTNFGLPGTVSVLLNTTASGATTPSFATQQTFAAGDLPWSVTAADVNGDGKPDLIVANEDDGTVSVLLNTTAPGATTPSFATKQTFATGNEPIFVTAADVNGDGKPDLIVANANDGTVSVLLNTTPAPATTFDSNSFATQQTFGTGTTPLSVTAADVTGDGKPDLIVANENDSTVSVLLNTTVPGAATPSFATQQTFATGTYPRSVTTADTTGDGMPDLIVANLGSSTVSVLRNTTAPGASAPSFAAQQTFAVGGNPYSVTAADVNGDGKPDLIVANLGDSTVSVLLNTTAPGATTPSFASQQTFAVGIAPISVTAADVNGDGKPDLIVANYGYSFESSTVSVLLNTTAPGATTPSFAAQQTFAVGSEPASVTAADVNGDGKPDLIVANNNGDTVSVLLNTTGPGATTPSFATQHTFGVGSVPWSVTAADVNGDGKPDLIVTNNNDNTVSVLINATAPGAATPSFATQQTFGVGSAPRSVSVADVNGDGMPDVIVANDSGNAVSVLLNTLYTTTISGSPATGTIYYGVPTPSPTPTASATATATATATPTATATATSTATATATNTATATSTATATATNTATATATNTATATATSTATATATPTATATDTATATPTTTATATPSATATPTTTLTVTASLAFGNVAVGQTATKNLTVHNSGRTNSLVISSATPSDSEYALSGTGTCGPIPVTLAPLASCTLGVAFTPDAIGSHSASLMLFDNATTSPQHATLTGAGIAGLSLSKSALVYGSVKFGGKAPQAFGVAKHQSQLVTLNESFSGTNPSDFTVSGGTCGPTLAATTECSIIVTFKPSVLGTESASLSVSDSPDPSSPYTVAITTGPTIPDTVTPATLSYGTVSHTSSKTLKATITNHSPFTLSVGSTVMGMNSADFTISGGSCGASLSGNTSCPIAVTFKPTTTSTESAALQVTVGSDPLSPHNLNLTGTGS